jgi:pyruvate kinase
MVARGDLGLELPLERVPGAQKLIINQANYRGTPVITATQMLRSMVRDLRPTRAEVTDVCTAVRDGTDAVMLSDETAIGKHPVTSVATLSKIALEAEMEFQDEVSSIGLKGQDRSSVPDAVCYAATYAAAKISAGAVVACTQSGATGRLMAKYRPQQLLFGATSERRTLTRMALYWGVEPILVELPEHCTTEDEINCALAVVRDQYGFKPGARIVITTGLRSKKVGTTNVMEIREIPRTN